VPLEDTLDGLALDLQPVPVLRDLPGLRGAFGRRLGVGGRAVPADYLNPRGTLSQVATVSASRSSNRSMRSPRSRSMTMVP
jgi:hypothetical protein